jgi:hypothetical protein
MDHRPATALLYVVFAVGCGGTTEPEFDSLVVSTNSLPDGVENVPYGGETLAASGGDGSYAWTVTTGALPTGLSLSPAGMISGTPAMAETQDFTVRVTSGDGQSAQRALSIVVHSATPLISDLTASLGPVNPNGSACLNLEFAFEDADGDVEVSPPVRFQTLFSNGGTHDQTWSGGATGDGASGTVQAGICHFLTISRTSVDQSVSLFDLAGHESNVLTTTLPLPLSVPIVNAGFEDPVLSDAAYTDNDVPGWIGSDLGEINNFGVFNPQTTFFTTEAPVGSNVAYIERGALSQTLADVLEVNTTYELKAQLGDSKIDPIEGYALQLLAGGIVLAEVTMPTLVDDTFSEVALSYESVNSDPIGQALEIRIVEDGADKTSELYIDDVRLFKRQ